MNSSAGKQNNLFLDTLIFFEKFSSFFYKCSVFTNIRNIEIKSFLLSIALNRKFSRFLNKLIYFLLIKMNDHCNFNQNIFCYYLCVLRLAGNFRIGAWTYSTGLETRKTSIHFLTSSTLEKRCFIRVCWIDRIKW